MNEFRALCDVVLAGSVHLPHLARGQQRSDSDWAAELNGGEDWLTSWRVWAPILNINSCGSESLALGRGPSRGTSASWCSRQPCGFKDLMYFLFVCFLFVFFKQDFSSTLNYRNASFAPVLSDGALWRCIFSNWLLSFRVSFKTAPSC